MDSILSVHISYCCGDLEFQFDMETDAKLPEIVQTEQEVIPIKEKSVNDTPSKSITYRQDSEEDFYGDKQHRRQSIPWTPEEDQYLEHLVILYESKNWQTIAYELHSKFPHRPRRSVNQCNQRWMRVLNPAITKGKWTNEEDRMLLNAIKQSQPRKWKQIAELLPGRTDTQVRYRINKISQWLLDHGVSMSHLE